MVLEVRLLGEQSVVGSSGEGRQPSPRALALLAYLVLSEGFAPSRQQLAGVFWPDSTEPQARTNLRRELHHLRTVLDDDPSLVVSGAALAWHDQPSCLVDVRRFRDARRAARAALAAGDVRAFLDHADAAFAQYRGELMPGAYDDWVLEHRDALRRQCVDLCVPAVREWRRAGDLVRAQEIARLRVNLDPLGESGYRDLMRVQAEAGDRAGAMSTYHRCASVLERELGIGPDPETTRSLELLLGSRPDDRPTVPRPRAARSGAATGLVGRDAETGALVRHWDRACAGASAMVLVSGEPGVGKSRLVAELTAAARTSGALVATTRCFGVSGRLPLAPVADWLRSDDLRAAIATLDPTWRAEVDRLVPGAGARPPDSAHAMVDGWQRHRLFEGLARAVLAPARPTLLVLDDLQWCDEETAAWLTFLLGVAADAPLLVAATVRTDEPEDDRGAWAAVRALRSSRLVREISLSPLSPEGAEQLATAVRGRALTAPEQAFVHAATGGYPLFVVEAARGLPEVADDTAPLPVADLGGVLDHRLDEISAAAREVAGLAAAFGRDFSLDLLTEAGDLDAEALVRAVDELWRRRILREHRGGYDFSHDLLRQAAYEAVSPPRRWLLHRRLAQGLELLHAGHLDDVAAQLADQYDRGGRPDRALAYFTRSAALAEAVFANVEALRHHRRCLELVSALPAGRDRDARELAVLRAMSAPLNARHGYSSPELQRTLERSATLAEKLGRRETVVESLVGLFAARIVQGETALAHEIAGRALAMSQGDVDPDLVAQAHFAFAGSAFHLGMPATGVEHFDLSSHLSPDGVSLLFGTRLEVHARGWAAHAHWILGADDVALANCTAAVEMARSIDHPWSLTVALAYAAITHQLRDDREAVRTAAAELTELCRRYEFAYYSEWAPILDGWASGGERGLVAITAGIATLRAHGSFARMPYWLSLQAELLVETGRPDAACAVLDAARAAAGQRDDRWWLPEVLRRRAALGPPEAAAAMLTEALAMAVDQQSPPLAARCRADLANLAARGDLAARATTVDVRPAPVRTT
jgi:DNA-binding SARP family transcriptional activator